jgi:hypothetical protein
MVPDDIGRRKLLAAIAGGAAGGMAGCAGILGGDPQSTAEPVADEEARRLAEAYAPDIYFDSRETWFPTDPRPHESEADGDPVVTGFDAVEGYLQAYEDGGGEPPDPTLFYRALRYEDSSLAVVQFWMYAAFDQFTTNFHWHDWEVLHVFVDVDEAEPKLYVASSHSRKVPNNEHLDPETAPRILSELGSHSSGMSVNDQPTSFQRLPDGDSVADVTNEALNALDALSDFPLAYGLPRDEGSRLPYVVPELDDAPVYDHPQVPTFAREHLAPPELTVRSFATLSAPPTGLPARETGIEMAHGGGDVAYDLVPTADLEHITAFTGPQLSFEFAVPKFVEDAFAGHITTAGVPWEQARYDAPLVDVSDPTHRNEMANRYDVVTSGGAAANVVGVLAGLTGDEDAPDGEGVRSTSLGVEGVALLESDPETVPTFGGGVVAMQDVPEGDHRLTVNVAGTAPYSERLAVDAGDPTGTTSASDTDASSTATEPSPTETATAPSTTATAPSTTATAPSGTDGPPGTAVAGAGGQVSMVPQSAAVKLRLDGDGADTPVASVAVRDDFGGRVFENRVDGEEAVYVHRGGAYTADVADEDGTPGAFRVNPGRGEAETTIERPETGKASLAAYLVDLFAETRGTVEEAVDDEREVRGLLQALSAVEDSATRAVEAARSGNPKAADQRLDAVLTRVENVREALTDAALSGPAERAVDRRGALGEEKARQAKRTEA